MSKPNLHAEVARFREVSLFGNKVFLLEKIRDFKFCIRFIKDSAKRCGHMTMEMSEETEIYELLIRHYEERMRHIK